MSNLRGNLLAALCCFLWGSAFIFGKIALDILPPLRLAGVRLSLVTVMLVPFLRKNPLKVLRQTKGWILPLSLFQTIFSFTLFNYGLKLVPGSFGACIIGTSPAISSLVAVVCIPEEKLTSRSTGGILLGLFAIIILSLSRQPWTGPGRREILGACLLMINCIFGAYGNVLMKRQLQDADTLSVNFLQTLIGASMIMLLSFSFEPPEPVAISKALVVSVFCLASITAIASTLWIKIIQQKNTKIAEISVWKMLIPFTGAVLSWLLVPQDSLTMTSLLCLVVIGLSIFLSVTKKGVPGQAGQSTIMLREKEYL